MFERFTVPARETVIRAQAEAKAFNHHLVGTEHLLLALTHPDAGVAYDVLRQAGIDRATVSAAIDRHVTAHRPLSEEDSAALRTVGIDLDVVIAQVEESFGPGALDAPLEPAGRSVFGRRRESHGFGPRHISARVKKVLGLSLREAIHRKHNFIGTEHLLLGLLREGNGLAAKIIADQGVRLDDLRDAAVGRLDQAA